MRVAALVAAAIVLVGCGSTRHVAHGCVRVYFQRDTRRSQERAVSASIQRDKRVTRVVFVSKAEALRQEKRKHPALFSSPMPFNPLPDALRVQTRDAAAARTFARDWAPNPPALSFVQLTRLGGRC